MQLTYPESLPISERRDDIVAALRSHQVVIVAGETGSGKSTQLPKMCLEAAGDDAGLIGHTQPRRLAARTVAERLAEELGTAIGEVVGYTVRFTDRVGPATRVKVMTDGILLAELQRDRSLRRYRTLIVDEAHERSLNIDFILGYLKQLLPRRADLNVVVTSATIDTERFAAHFGGAPVIEVSGRTYPVEVRYRPLVADDLDRDLIEALADAVAELCREGPGDILVFLSGEREIRDAADALARRELGVDLLPLFARLSMAEQHRVFAPHAGRRVVLATNVAETSLTVPGVRYVVDAGTARISRYNRRTKVQRLPIEPVSRASADQRAGRCGRVGPGVCIRLYAEDDYLDRPEFTEPEILRTNLASVILQMAAIGLGDIERFPFVDPPDARNIRDGLVLLEELGALTPGEDRQVRLTPVGRRLAQLPVDPRLGRMILEADRFGCADDVMVVVAALSIQDPRERPLEQQAAADELHARFADPASDFTALLNLWAYLGERQAELSSGQFRRLCRAELLNYVRVREWQDLYAQLRQVTRSLGIRRTHADDAGDAVHRALLAGLLSQVGMRDDERRDYLGARNARFSIAPGSALFKRPPRWVMAAELVETTRLWARVAARVHPSWIEQAAAHLLKRSYGDAYWDADRGAAMTTERATLYGIPVVQERRVNLARVDPALARELFIRHALVEGDWTTHHAFDAVNRQLVADVRSLEDRARRPGILVSDEVRVAFFESRVPTDVASARQFDKWWNGRRAADPDLLTFTPEVLVEAGRAHVDPDAFPESWDVGDLRLPLSYRFEPGADDDGVTVHVPLAVLNRLSPEAFEWHVPGFRHELVTELIRSLPKQLRKNFVPAPDVARDVVESTSPSDGALLDVVGAALARRSGVFVPHDAWRLELLAPHLRPSFHVEDERGIAIATGKDLGELQAGLRRRMRASITGLVNVGVRTGAKRWEFGTVDRVVKGSASGHEVEAFPALVDEGESVGLRVVDSGSEQAASMWAATRRLLLLTVRSPLAEERRRLPNRVKLALTAAGGTTVDDMLEDCLRCALDHLIARGGGPAWDEAAFTALHADVARALPATLHEVVGSAADVLQSARELELRLDRLTAPALEATVADIGRQLSRLVYPGFVSATGHDRLPDLLRYVTAMHRRLDKVGESPARDRSRAGAIRALEDRYDAVVRALPPVRRGAADVRAIRWQLEELRVSEFAQAVGAKQPVSTARIQRALDALLSAPE